MPVTLGAGARWLIPGRPRRAGCRYRGGSQVISVVISASSGNAAFSAATEDGVEMLPEASGDRGSAVESPASAEDAAAQAVYDVRAQVARRRTFAIISHPDAGKTTMTEKLLLYGGAIHEAGAVKARRSQRSATSDWMAIEKERGISITSTVLTFEHGGKVLNLLDTPGHQDFSEDTYRTLAAADNALMLVDGAKGLEDRTRKLFAVCHMREMPLFSFVNKMDRPSLSPYELIDQLEKEFQLSTYAVNWPIGSGPDFCGVYHRPDRQVHLFAKSTAQEKARGAASQSISIDDKATLGGLLSPELLGQLLDDVALMEELGSPLDLDDVAKGKQTPVFFGSAMNNFGVSLFLRSFEDLACPPGAHAAVGGETVAAEDEAFTGLVFKIQANMDARHFDSVAFVRVCSGVFTRGMKVILARTGQTLALTRPQKLFAQDRTTIDVAFAGDVIGLNNPGAFAIGDTIHAVGTARRRFPGIPSFSPELFAYLRTTDPSKRKQFSKGLDNLLGEGAVQVLFPRDEFSGRQDPILAAVGQLQFDVVCSRLKAEYGVETELEAIPVTVARWVRGGWPVVEGAGRLFNTLVVRDRWARPVLLFKNTWNETQLLIECKSLVGKLFATAMPPGSGED